MHVSMDSKEKRATKGWNEPEAYTLCTVSTHACPHSSSEAPHWSMSSHEHFVAGLLTDDGRASSAALKFGHFFGGIRRGRSKVSETFGVAEVEER